MDPIAASLPLALAAAALLAAGPLGSRAGLWSYIVGFAFVLVSVVLALAAIGLSLLAAWQDAFTLRAAAALVIGLLVAAVPLRFIVSARGAPIINDISTDLDDPPAFEALLPPRAGAAVPRGRPDPAVAARQRRAYPDVQTLELDCTGREAFRRAIRTVHALGWRIAASDELDGRIEATETTFWFGFQDDVVIRVRDIGGRSRVDVRSASRVGRGDAGTNAARVRMLLRAIGAP